MTTSTNTPPRRRPSWHGLSDKAQTYITDVPQLGPGLRRGGAYSEEWN